MGNYKMNAGPEETIASFNPITKKWKKCGQLNEARNRHGVIYHNGAFIIIGGGVLDIPSKKTIRVAYKDRQEIFYFVQNSYRNILEKVSFWGRQLSSH